MSYLSLVLALVIVVQGYLAYRERMAVRRAQDARERHLLNRIQAPQYLDFEPQPQEPQPEPEPDETAMVGRVIYEPEDNGSGD